MRDLRNVFRKNDVQLAFWVCQPGNAYAVRGRDAFLRLCFAGLWGGA